MNNPLKKLWRKIFPLPVPAPAAPPEPTTFVNFYPTGYVMTLLSAARKKNRKIVQSGVPSRAMHYRVTHKGQLDFEAVRVKPEVWGVTFSKEFWHQNPANVETPKPAAP